MVPLMSMPSSFSARAMGSGGPADHASATGSYTSVVASGWHAHDDAGSDDALP